MASVRVASLGDGKVAAQRRLHQPVRRVPHLRRGVRDAEIDERTEQRSTDRLADHAHEQIGRVAAPRS